MRFLIGATALIAMVLIGAISVGVPTAARAQAGTTMTTSSGLKITDTKIWTGTTPKTGQTCVMHYTG